MTILVTDSGFATDDWRDAILEPEAILAGAGGANLGVALSSSADPALLRGVLDTIDLIRVDFPSFSDGRGFTIARRLRLLGYQGRLRASGPLLSDQYAMARRAGKSPTIWLPAKPRINGSPAPTGVSTTIKAACAPDTRAHPKLNKGAAKSARSA